MNVRKSNPKEVDEILQIHRLAFKEDDEAILVEKLLSDPSAQPILSLIAEIEGEPAGHILFTTVKITGREDVKVSILAPLAVIPQHQGKGVGGELVKEGLSSSKNQEPT